MIDVPSGESTAKAEVTAKLADQFDMPALIRLGVWGMGAVLALAAAVIAAQSQLTPRQASNQPTSAATSPEPARVVSSAQLLARIGEIDAETHRLADSIRSLGVDHDRLTARLSVLERNLEGMTGSIAPQTTTPPARSTTGLSAPLPAQSAITQSMATASAATIPPALRPPTVTVSAAQNGAPLPGTTVTTEAPTTPRTGRMAMIESYARAKPDPLPTTRAMAGDDSPSESVVTTTDFGVDLGGAPSVNGLRAMWIALKTKHAQLLGGLWPIMSVHDRAKPGVNLELRLVAGPLPNASHAARLCASFAALGVACQPAVFDGQRLALR
jgi:hypothetical protein